MLAYVGGGIRITSWPHEIGCINGHGEALLVVKLRGMTLKTECLKCLRRILPTREKKPSIYLLEINGVLWQGLHNLVRDGQTSLSGTMCGNKQAQATFPLTHSS
jgi:hypothetical protein